MKILIEVWFEIPWLRHVEVPGILQLSVLDFDVSLIKYSLLY
jgi:hypothetical protein